jgi:predicted ester cyclase
MGRFDDGRLAEHWSYADWMGLVAQLGTEG